MNPFKHDPSLRCIVENDFRMNGIRVFLGEQTSTGLFVIEGPSDGFTHRMVSEDDATPITPMLRLREDHARILLDKLSEFFGGSSPVQQARADILHERKVNDEMRSALIEMTHSIRSLADKALSR